jgi:hypothetical protein
MDEGTPIHLLRAMQNSKICIKNNDGNLSGPIHISKRGRHRCRLSQDLIYIYMHILIKLLKWKQSTQNRMLLTTRKTTQTILHAADLSYVSKTRR